MIPGIPICGIFLGAFGTLGLGQVITASKGRVWSSTASTLPVSYTLGESIAFGVSDIKDVLTSKTCFVAPISFLIYIAITCINETEQTKQPLFLPIYPPELFQYTQRRISH